MARTVAETVALPGSSMLDAHPALDALLATMLVFLVLVTYVPILSLWLPQTLGML